MAQITSLRPPRQRTMSGECVLEKHVSHAGSGRGSVMAGIHVVAASVTNTIVITFPSANDGV
jgi:hypothetical protein